MPSEKLTDRRVKSVKAKKGTRLALFDTASRGLALRVTGTGHKSWAFVYRRRRDRKLQWLTLGTLRDLTLADARAEADSQRALRSKDVDPVAAKNAARAQAQAAKTFGELCERYVEYVRTRARKPKKSWANDARILLGAERTAEIIREIGGTKLTKKIRRKRAEPLIDVWGAKALNEITRGDVHALLDKIEARAPIQSNRTLSCLKAAFNYAVDREWMEANPAARIAPRGEERTGEHTLSPDDLRALSSALEKESTLIGDVCTNAALYRPTLRRSVRHEVERD